MVIGANDGRSFDPAWEFGYWKKSPHHTIVWVEPNPILFKKLEGNTADIANKVDTPRTSLFVNIFHFVRSCGPLTILCRCCSTKRCAR